MPLEPHFLDFSAADFSTRSAAVLVARDHHWAATTPFGLAVLRHRQAGQLLRDRRLRQGSYSWPERMGLTGSFARFWSQSIISQEGARHKDWRRLVMSTLSEAHVLSLVPDFKRAADHLLAEMIQKETCEFMTDFAIPFAGLVNCALLGLPQGQWRQVSTHAANLGLAMGMDCLRHQPVFNASCDWLTDLAQSLVERARCDACDISYPSRLTRAFDQSGMTDQQVLLDLIVISIFGGVDTTKGQLGFIMSLFDQHPEQWQKLRHSPDLAEAAVQEAIRLRPTTTWATREAVEDFEFEGVEIKSGTTVHILVHASGTDSAVHDGQFDITAPRKVHFGFGGGAHHCLGHFLARTDIAVALQRLSSTLGHFAITEARFQPDSGNTSPISLNMHYSIAG